MWCWRRLEMISLTDCVRNEAVLHRVKEERMTNWIGHILHRNCLLKHVTEENTEGGIEVTGRYQRRLKQLLYDQKATRGYWQ
jgi:hypothetical protein